MSLKHIDALQYLKELDVSTKSILDPQEIIQLLHHYSNRQFIEILINIIRYEIHVEYERSSIQIQHPNHAFAYVNSKIIIEIIQSELMKDRIKEIKSFSNRYFYFSKHHRWKLIHHH